MGDFAKGVIFQFFGYFFVFSDKESSCVLYKKKLIYANLFFSVTGDKKSGTLQRKQKMRHNA